MMKRLSFPAVLFFFFSMSVAVPAVSAAQERSLPASGQEILVFDRDIRRVAASDDKILSFEVISNRELLVQARSTGRTNLLVWLADGSVRDITYLVRPLQHATEDVLSEAIHGLSNGIGQDVRVRRIVRENVPDDRADVFILEGRVPNQVALSRVLAVASHILTGPQTERQTVKVIADEAGALVSRRESAADGTASGSGVQLFRAGTGRGGGSLERALGNRIGKSIARAKVVEAAGGRLLSLIEVEDIPRVRISVKLLQVDRTKLKSYGSSLAVSVGRDPAPVLDIDTDVDSVPNWRNTVDVINGLFANQTQLSLDRVAMDALLSALESSGVARTLSEPNLSVLSGEVALFGVGGQVPIPAATATTAVVFNVVEFQDFGVEVAVRPLVGEDDRITLDLIPRVSDPVVNTFSTLTNAPAFESKTLKTTARLMDGQSLVVGGLIKREMSENISRSPWLSRIPLIGWMFKSADGQDNDTELLIVVTPVIEREPLPDFGLLRFPEISFRERLR